MKIASERSLKVADLVWVATALLHREHPDRADFSKAEILGRAAQEDPDGAARPGLSTHISAHCVASKKPDSAKHRMLTRTGTGRRRLFRRGDRTHEKRSSGNIMPRKEDLPEKYHYLLDWYENEYCRPRESMRAGELARGATAETLMRMMGRLSREDADELIRIIDESCGRVDANEW